MADGMLEPYATGVEGYTAVGIGAWSPVLEVALDGATYLGQLTANLVVSACVQVDFQEPVAVALGQNAIVQDSLFGIGYLVVVGPGGVVLGIAGKPVGECALRLWRLVAHDGPVGFLYLSGTEHVAQSAKCLAGTGKEYHTAYGTVKTVYHTKEHLTRFLVAFLDVLFHHIRKRHITGLVALYDVSRTLGNYDYVIILI